MAALFQWELLFSSLRSCCQALLQTAELAHTVHSFLVAWKRQSCPIAARRLIEADNVENLLADKYFWDGLCQEMCRKAVKELQEDVLKIFSLGSCPR